MRAEYDFSKGKRGALIANPGKTRISIFIDNDVLDAFRARAEGAGSGYQSMMNQALRQSLDAQNQHVTESSLRAILGEVMGGVAPRRVAAAKR